MPEPADLPSVLAEVEAHARLMRATWDHDGDPLAALGDLRRLGRLLGQAVPLAADAARDFGASWSAIGDRLGVTKQAAQQRFTASAPAPVQGESLFDVLATYGGPEAAD